MFRDWYYPCYVYALFPFDENGNICGVYVGRSTDPERRVHEHKYNYSYKEMHDLLLYNGFAYKVIDEIHDPDEDCIEYEWVDYFYHVCKRKNGWKLFNRVLGDKECMNLLERHINSQDWNVWLPKDKL